MIGMGEKGKNNNNSNNISNEPFIYDRTLRELLRELPERFILLLSGKKGIRFVDTQLPKVKERRPDLLVELEDKSIFHLEIQTRYDVNMDERMIEYYVLLKQVGEIKDKYLRQMVLYLIDSKKRKIPSGEREVMFDNGRLIFRYEVRYINDIECRPLMESESIDDNILSVLCKIEDFSFFWERLTKKILKFPISRRRDYFIKLLNLARLRPEIFKIIIIKLREEVEDMPLIIDKEKDLICPFFFRQL